MQPVFSSLQQQIAVALLNYLVDAIKRHFNKAGISARRYDKVVLQMLLIAVIDQVYARIYILISGPL